MNKTTLLFGLLSILLIPVCHAQILQQTTNSSNSAESVTFVNKTSKTVSIAVAYMGYADRIMKKSLVTKGWFTVEAGQSFTPDISKQILYYVAHSEDNSKKWIGDKSLYVQQQNSFTLSQLSSHPDEYFKNADKMSFIKVEDNQVILK